MLERVRKLKKYDLNWSYALKRVFRTRCGERKSRRSPVVPKVEEELLMQKGEHRKPGGNQTDSERRRNIEVVSIHSWVNQDFSMQGRQLSEHMSSVTMKQMPYFISSVTWNVGGVPFALCLSFMLIRNLTSFLHSTCKCACWQSFPFPYLSVFWQQERREQSWGFIETGMSTNHVNVLHIFQ